MPPAIFKKWSEATLKQSEATPYPTFALVLRLFLITLTCLVLAKAERLHAQDKIPPTFNETRPNQQTTKPPDNHPPDTLPLAIIRAQRLRQRPVGSPSDALPMDSLGLTRSVAEQLDRAGIYIRNYGPGSLSSISIRGGSAAQTLALWNGLPITNPSLGQIDWSLLNASDDAQQVSVTRGGNSALWGSGAVAASVNLEDRRDAADAPAYRLGATVGAFGERAARARVRLDGRRWQSISLLDHRTTDNDYPVRRPNSPTTRLPHAGLQQTNFRQTFYLQLPRSQNLEVRYWYQASERQIPPMIAQRRSAAEQSDGAHRFSLRYTAVQASGTLTATAGYFVERLDYQDTLADVDSRSHFSVALADLAWSRTVGKSGVLLLGSTASHTTAQVDDAYAGTSPQETSVAALASYRLDRGRWQTQASARYGHTNLQSLGFTPSLGLSYALSPVLTWRARASRDFRTPTFNDRFYQPGGNPDLRPESGYSVESGFDLETPRWSLGITGFRRDIQDWLLWGQAPDRPYFSAYNLTRVTSSGLEPRFGFRQNLPAAVQLDLRSGYDYVLALNREELRSPRLAAGQQLWYVPRHSAFAHLTLQRHRWRLAFLHRWRGATIGLNETVAASQTGDLTLGYTRTGRKLGLRGFVELCNVADVDYRLIERRPLPGRHVRVGVTLTR